MGNFFRKSNVNSGDNNKKPLVLPKSFVKVTHVRKDLSQASFSDSAVKLQSSSFGKIRSQKSNPPLPSFSRPWVKKRWNEKILFKPLKSSKTPWPVPCFQSLFLPEFKLRDDISESSFEFLGVISNGAFGKVFKVLKKDTEVIYAMKILSKAHIVANNLVNQVKEEVRIQQVVGHNEFIVNCPYYWQSKKQLYIISDYVSGGELLKLLQNKGPLPIDIVKLYVAELAVALDFLHNAGIIYRDLKLENVLLNAEGHIQLIDFGLSKWLKYGMRTNTVCGTLQYIAPEILQLKSYSHAVDWWSLGIVVVCMITGECPYERCVDDKGNVLPIPELMCCSEAKDLIHRLLVSDPVKRLRSLAALKRTAFFMGFDFENLLSVIVDLENLTVTKTRQISFS